MNRFDGRKTDELRPVKIIKDFTRYAEGSVLIEWGNTKVLCNVSVEESVPPFKKGSGEGWVTAEYSMLPRATATRNKRDINKLKLNQRSTEIQRLIGRALRQWILRSWAKEALRWTAMFCRRTAAPERHPSQAALLHWQWRVGNW